MCDSCTLVQDHLRNSIWYESRIALDILTWAGGKDGKLGGPLEIKEATLLARWNIINAILDYIKFLCNAETIYMRGLVSANQHGQVGTLH